MKIEEGCTCGRIGLNSITSEIVALNWEPGCLIHGVKSKWYLEEGKAHLDETRQRSIELQKLAREARLKARTTA